MARYKHYDYAQTMLVAVSLADQLQAGTLEHTIHYVVGPSYGVGLCGVWFSPS